MQIFTFRNVLTAGFILALLMAGGGGCTSGPSNGPRPESLGKGPFRHRWWHYYARGLSAGENRQYDNAIADIRTAIQKRDRDQYMARTYGMHFVDYFPHRELGILFWETRQLAAAQAHLQTSIDQTPTAKAAYYLDRVREEVIRRLREQGTISIRPPDIRLFVPEEGMLTRDDPVVISGKAADPNYVAALMVGGESVALELAKQVVDFRRPLDLPHGIHRVTISASSLSGLSHQKILTVHVDRQGPVIDVRSVEQTAPGSRHRRVLIGRAIDPSGVVSLTVNGSALTVESKKTAPFRIPLDQGIGEVTVSAWDQLGNATNIRFDVRDVSTISRPWESILLASREPVFLADRRSRRDDRQSPVIELTGWTSTQTVYMDKVVIEGHARDDRRLASISVNQRPVSGTALTGVIAAFNTSVSLAIGPNVISIEAEDAAGNRRLKKITIVRCNPKVRILNERLSVGILPFAVYGGISTTSDAFQDLILQQLALRKRFKLVDRSLLDIILQEHKISRTDLIASETALQMGRLSAADAFIYGSIIETRMGTEIISRMVDTETAEVLTIVDAFIEKQAALHGIRDAAEQLSLKLHREFPMVDGKIIDLNKQEIMTDLGERKLRAQRRILVIEERPVLHPETNHHLGKDYKVMGRARLVQIQKDFSKGRLQEKSDPAIKISHGVVTQ